LPSAVVHQGIAALTFLDISNNAIGDLSVPEGWRAVSHSGSQFFKPPGDEWAQSWTATPPPNAKPEGVIALVETIKYSKALAKLHIGYNHIPAKNQLEIASLCASKGIELRG
jgi:hypothetical protein